jgi:outer membrane protein assembly factor BamB
MVVGVLVLACAVPAALTLTAGPATPHSAAAAQSVAQPGGCCAATAAGDQDYSPLAQITPGDVHSLAGTERGVAVAAGRVFAALGHEHVVALSQQTGAVIWQTQVGTPGQAPGRALPGCSAAVTSGWRPPSMPSSG